MAEPWTISDEYRAALEKAVVFDLSTRGKIELAGKEALFFLNNLCTNDVKNLVCGRGCEAFLCTAKAKIVAHVGVGCFRHGDQDVIWLDSEPGQAEIILGHFNHYLISEQVELADRTSELGLLHLAGPQAEEILARVTGKTWSDLAPWNHRTEIMGEVGPCHIRRHDLLGIPGFDIFCPGQSTTVLQDLLSASGARAGGSQTWEILRVEAGTPVYGKDMDENRLVMEVGRQSQAISYTKGCFLGQEPIVMARDRGHINRTLLGIKLGEGGPVSVGAKLYKDANEVGSVTSSVVSPRFGPIALAYIKRGFQEPGTELQVDPAGDGRQAVVAGKFVEPQTQGKDDSGPLI